MSVNEPLSEFRRPRSYRTEFEQHASPEAIKAHIEKARKRQTEIQNELGWLEGLYLRRVGEASPSRLEKQDPGKRHTVPASDARRELWSQFVTEYPNEEHSRERFEDFLAMVRGDA